MQKLVSLVRSAAIVSAAGVALSAGAQPAGDAPPADPAAEYFEDIPAQAPSYLVDLAGQRYAQALPALGREDIHAALESSVGSAGYCEPIFEPIVEPAVSITERIVELAGETQIVIINEAHDMPRHRELTRSIIALLRERGYGYFAAEAFSGHVAEHPDEAFGRLDAGSIYAREPTFGRLIRAAKQSGYELVAYEADPPPDASRMSTAEQVAFREEGQADNLVARIFSRDPDAKVVIHVGYSHVVEVPIPSFGVDMPWMAARLKAKTGIDPLTIDQTHCESASDAVHFAYPTGRMLPGAFDLSVAHPRTTFERGRPTWRLAAGARLVDLPAELTDRAARTIVEARFFDEPRDAIPVDRLLLWPEETIPLVLPPGTFRITALEEGHVQPQEVVLTVAP